MSNRAADRAEARRRARLAARGELPEEEPTDEPPAREAAGAGLLRRIFPPAPPLPGRPDPLDGFTHEGALRPVAVRLYLLGRNPLAWVVPGIAWGTLYPFALGSSVVSLIASLASFAVLIAAGWFGWQRPTLFGTASGVVGVFVAASVAFAFFVSQGERADVAAINIAANGALTLVFQTAVGFVAGWYGGYLRRRQAQVRRATPGQRQRR